MVNQNQPLTKIPAVRTYARDLEINREAAGLTAAENAEKEVKKVPLENKNTVKQIYKGPAIIADVPAPKKVALAPKKLTEFSSENTTFLVDNEDAASATIITDTKKDRFKLIPSVIASVKTWFENKKLAFQKKKSPKYTVPETTRRKGVIQKATSVTGRFATSDFGSIHDRIRQRKLKEEKEDDEPTITWSANTEPGYLLLENGEVEVTPITNVKIEAKKSFRTVPPQVVAVVEKKVEAPKTIAPTIELPPVPVDPAPVIEYVPEEIKKVIEDLPEEEAVEYVPEATQKKKVPFRLLSLDTNTLSLGFSGLVLAVIIVAAYGYFSFKSPDLTIGNIPAANASEAIIDIPLEMVSGTSVTRESLLSTLAINKPQGVGKGIQLVFLSTEPDSVVIPPSILLSLLNINLEQNFTKTISIIRTGYGKDLTKFILIKTTNSNATKGGLLMWEENMRKDLAGILDFDIKPSYGLRFVDATLGGIDVRILKNKDGAEEIVYGQVNNLIIITDTSTSFSELMKLKK